MLLNFQKCMEQCSPLRIMQLQVSIIAGLKNCDLKYKPKMSAFEESTPFNAVTFRTRNQTRKYVSKLRMTIF